MKERLYPDFLMDAEQYAQAESLWRAEWDRLLGGQRKQDSWRTPWLSHAFADGTPCRDGNPIFSAVCSNQHRGVRVIQIAPDRHAPPFTYWTDTFAAGDPDAIDELVISCQLTRKTLADSLSLIQRWMNGEAIVASTASRVAPRR